MNKDEMEYKKKKQIKTQSHDMTSREMKVENVFNTFSNFISKEMKKENETNHFIFGFLIPVL